MVSVGREGVAKAPVVPRRKAPRADGPPAPRVGAGLKPREAAASEGEAHARVIAVAVGAPIGPHPVVPALEPRPPDAAAVAEGGEACAGEAAVPGRRVIGAAIFACPRCDRRGPAPGPPYARVEPRAPSSSRRKPRVGPDRAEALGGPAPEGGLLRRLAVGGPEGVVGVIKREEGEAARVIRPAAEAAARRAAVARLERDGPAARKA